MISILLATYNGEKYLRQQLESLLNQTYDDFIVWVSDDASTDSTWEILEEYSVRYPRKFKLSQRITNSGSSKYNFMEMMLSIKDDYLMLCDQDDIWLPSKIEQTYKVMKSAESRYGQQTPIVVHTDLIVTNKNLDTISPSFREAMNLSFDRTQLKDQIIQNTLTGCTAMYNRNLAKLIDTIPDYLIMHDWWLMLYASAFGKIEPLCEQTVFYRQHEQNAIGAKNVKTWSYKIQKLARCKEVQAALHGTYLQAENFLKINKNKLSYEQRELLETYCRVPKMSKFMRWYTVYRLGVLKDGIFRRIAAFVFI